MTPPVPSWIAAPVLGFAFVVAVARWILVRESAINRLVNRMLSWQVAAGAVFEAGHGSQFADATYRLFLGCGVITVACAYGISALFAGADPATARRRQRGYDAIAAVCAVIVMIIGRPADPAQPSFEWKVPLLWAIFNIPTTILAVNIIRASLRDLRVSTATLRERFVFSALFLVAVYCLYCAVSAAVHVLRGQPSDSPPTTWTQASCFSFFVISALLALPVVNTVLARVGWDRTGRDHRKLFPLWRDLTAAVPGIVLDQGTARLGSEPRLYRRLIEIQDAVQHLKQYMPPGDQRSVDGYAVRLAQAAENKLRGCAPVVAAQERGEPVVRDRAAELDDLLRLARAWPAARAAASAGALAR
ncbi:hypothetical protein DFR70_103398 [Nocardia tenerifensis]|uniref:DUF6545 domain-containing protein n=1 Tax=Nocardia tenerifensis TaxID=228006 RepID=A0A318K4V2_9NOCA|nr:MAB_1171c family putative transporter [Nocardia tenerifensis]PXX66649.1 hypothetical protein DFR70_103398 [Nocardia tenerifensis]